MKKAYIEKFDDFEALSDSLLGFEIEFRDRKNFDTMSSKLSSLIGEDVTVERLGEWNKGNIDGVTLREKWSRQGGLHFEIVTPPVKYDKARKRLEEILDWMNSENFRTNKGTGLHVNVSFESKPLRRNFNAVKFAAQFDEGDVFDVFSGREKSFYARPLFDFLRVNPNMSLARGCKLEDQLSFENDKSAAFNMSKLASGYVEARYIGGEDYPSKKDEILDIIKELVMAIHKSGTGRITREDRATLRELAKGPIERSLAFKNYDNFVERYPEVDLSVDMNGSEHIVRAYFDKIAPLLSRVMPQPGQTKIWANYDADISKLQLKDAYLMDVRHAKNTEFFGCTLRGVFEDCRFQDCEIRNSRIRDGFFTRSVVRSTHAAHSTLTKTVELHGSFLRNSKVSANIDSKSVTLFCEIDETAEVDDKAKIIEAEDD